jgi:hypothetical protein
MFLGFFVYVQWNGRMLQGDYLWKKWNGAVLGSFQTGTLSHDFPGKYNGTYKRPRNGCYQFWESKPEASK